MTKNILILSNYIGGLYTFRKEVIQGIINAGYNVFISIPDIKNTDIISYFEIMGCVIIPTIFDRGGGKPTG